MSKRSERREAERLARKLAYQQRLQSPAAAAPVEPEPSPAGNELDLLARAQAFFDRPAQTTASTAQVEANRANAQFSTGPITREGKAISARNNTRHGLTAESNPQEFKVLANEDQNAYNQNLAEFEKEWKPATATEHDLVHRLAMHQWLRLRAVRLQEGLFSPATGEIADVKKFELYRRYETTHERGFNKAFSDLLRLRSFQMRERNGFESQKRKSEEHEFKMQRIKDQDERKKSDLQLKLDRKRPAQPDEALAKAA